MPSSDLTVQDAEISAAGPVEPEPEPKKTRIEKPDRIKKARRNKDGSERVHWLSRDEWGNYEIHIYRCGPESIRGDYRKVAGKKHDWVRIDDSIELVRYNTTMRARGLYLFMKAKHLERSTQGGYNELLSGLGGFTGKQWLVGAAVVGVGCVLLFAFWPLVT